MAESKPPLPVEERRKRKETAVGALVSARLEHDVKGGQQVAMVGRLASNWGAICPLLAPWSWPLRLSRGTLTVAVTGDSVKQELFYATPTLLAAANLLAGYEAVKRVSFEPGKAGGQRGQALPPGRATIKQPAAAWMDNAERACKGVPDENLRAALTRLGAWICKE